MVNYSFTSEQEQFRTEIREFCEQILAPLTNQLEHAEPMPTDIVKALADKGLLGMMIEKRFGGMEMDALMTGIVAEELARVDPGCAIPVFFLVENSWGHILNKHGTEKAKEEILPDVVTGKRFLGVATTESSGGSDLGAMVTTIQKNETAEKDGYLINGGKMYISGVKEALRDGGGHITMAKMDPSKGTRGMNLFYLPIKDVKGITPNFIEEMGRDGISWGGFAINEVEIPSHYLIGEEQKGFYIVHEGYELARGLIGMVCVGAATKALENGIRAIKQRTAFGKPIGKYEGIQFKLAEGHVKIDSLRYLSQKALWTYDQEQLGNKERFDTSLAAAMAKSVATQWSFEVINDVMQWQGAFGYSTLCPDQKALRGVRSFSLAEGTAEIMKLIISRELLGKDFIAYK